MMVSNEYLDYEEILDKRIEQVITNLLDKQISKKKALLLINLHLDAELHQLRNMLEDAQAILEHELKKQNGEKDV